MQDVVWAALHSAREKQREGEEWGGAVKRALEENMWGLRAAHTCITQFAFTANCALG